MCRVHRTPRRNWLLPDPNDPVLKGVSLENWRKTIRSDTGEVVIHQIWSDPNTQTEVWDETAWKGESQFQIRPRRENPASLTAQSAAKAVPSAMPKPASSSIGESGTGDISSDVRKTGSKEGEKIVETKPSSPKGTNNRWTPLGTEAERTIPDNSNEGYGPVRLRQTKGPPMFLLRPPGTRMEALQEVLEEAHGTNRSLSPDGTSSAPNKCSKTDSDECLMTELVQETGPAPCVEVLVASFLQKKTKMQKELHHSKNPPMIQEQIDLAKTAEWTTLRDEKKALKVLSPSEAKKIRGYKSDQRGLQK